jgi:DNA-binding LytR/AlgR family response regulator
MITCIIIDDQKEAIGVIEDHLKKFAQLTLIAVFTDSLEGLEFLEKKQVDLVFLDIEMPNLNGLDFIESLRSKKGKDIPKFIFTTGYHKYALSGYEKGVIDFLIKPIGFTRFKMSMDRLIDAWKDPSSLNKNIHKEYFFMELDGIKIKINYENIMYIESERNCIHIYEKKVKRTFYKTMNYIESILINNEDFIRVHKSFIISINYAERITSSDIVMNIGNGKKKTISIGRTYKEAVLKKLKHF